MGKSKTWDFWLLNKHIPDNLCDFIIENFTDYTEGTVVSGKSHEVKQNIRNSDICCCYLFGSIS